MDSIRKLGRLAGIGASDVSTPSSSGIPQIQLLDFFFPGFSTFSAAVLKYLGIDLNVYIPLVLLFGAATFAWRYFSDYVW
jgi:chaperone BCS1